MEVFKTIPFLDQYPGWVRAAIALWIIFSACMLVVLLIVPRSGVTESGKESSTSEDNDVVSETAKINTAEINNHWDAAKLGILKLDCGQYRMPANPGISTAATEFCEVIAEARHNMMILVRLRRVLLGDDEDFPNDIIRSDKLKRHFENTYSEVKNGPKKDIILGVIDYLEALKEKLLTISSRTQLSQWNFSSVMTIDDMIIANGTLDYLISWDARERLSPKEIFSLGPFYEFAFPSEEKGRLILKEYERVADEPDGPIGSYDEVIGLWD